MSLGPPHRSWAPSARWGGGGVPRVPEKPGEREPPRAGRWVRGPGRVGAPPQAGPAARPPPPAGGANLAAGRGGAAAARSARAELGGPARPEFAGSARRRPRPAAPSWRTCGRPARSGLRRQEVQPSPRSGSHGLSPASPSTGRTAAGRGAGRGAGRRRGPFKGTARRPRARALAAPGRAPGAGWASGALGSRAGPGTGIGAKGPGRAQGWQTGCPGRRSGMESRAGVLGWAKGIGGSRAGTKEEGRGFREGHRGQGLGRRVPWRIRALVGQGVASGNGGPWRGWGRHPSLLCPTFPSSCLAPGVGPTHTLPDPPAPTRTLKPGGPGPGASPPRGCFVCPGQAPVRGAVQARVRERPCRSQAQGAGRQPPTWAGELRAK